MARDLFMLSLANPDFTVLDFNTLNFNATNLSLEDKSRYKNSENVRKHFTDENGKFDENAFNKKYDQVLNSLLYMASDLFTKDLKSSVVFSEDNFFAPRQQTYSRKPVIALVFNPTEQTSSWTHLGRLGDRTKSDEEIALKQLVLANPLLAYDEFGNIKEDVAKWQEAPDQGILSKQFWSNFRETRVLAQWDKDGEHKNPLTGLLENHVKGLLRYNKYGKPYYENLQGRSIYGKIVLNKGNVITPEDSKANEYDFFDSDDLTAKSYTGTIAKNLALVGSMFLPYVGPWIAGISMATLVARLGAIAGKFTHADDSPILNEIEGWVTSVDRLQLKTEYDKLHPWSFNNFVSACADLAALLREQRAIFNTIPGLVKGKFVTSEAALKKIELELIGKAVQKLYALYLEAGSAEAVKLTEEIAAARKALKAALAAGNAEEIAAAEKILNGALNRTAKYSMTAEQMLTAKNAGELIGQKEALEFFKSYNTIGSALSKTYMAGLISSNLYNEARTAGIDNDTAAWLTIGRFAAEIALLNTSIGEYFIPELYITGMEKKAMTNALVADVKKLFENYKGPKEGFFKKVFELAGKLPEKGRNILKSKKGFNKDWLESSLYMGAEAGIVNDIEEALNDLAKASHTIFVRNNEHFQAFENNWDRYGMGFFSGLIGGSISSGVLNYKTVSAVQNMDRSAALQKLIYLTRNGEVDKWLKDINETTIGNKYLSANPVRNEDGTISFRQGTETDNLDLYLKQMLRGTVELIKSIMDMNGTVVSDNQFLNNLILNDMRMNYMMASTASDKFLNKFLELTAKMIKLHDELNPLFSVEDGLKAEFKKAQQELLERNPDKVLELQNTIDEIKNLVAGGKALDFAKLAYYELTPAINSIFSLAAIDERSYVELKENKKFEDIPDNIKRERIKEFNDLKDSGQLSDALQRVSDIFFDNFVFKTSKELENWQPIYELLSKSNEFKILQNWHKLAYRLGLMDPEVLSKLSDDEWVQHAQSLELLAEIDVSKQLGDYAGMDMSWALEPTPELRRQHFFNAYTLVFSKIVTPLLKLEYINPEMRDILSLQIRTYVAMLKRVIPTYTFDVKSFVDRFNEDFKEILDFTDGTFNLEVEPLPDNYNQKTIEAIIEALSEDSTPFPTDPLEFIENVNYGGYSYNELYDKLGDRFSEDDLRMFESTMNTKAYLLSTNGILDNAQILLLGGQASSVTGTVSRESRDGIINTKPNTPITQFVDSYIKALNGEPLVVDLLKQLNLKLHDNYADLTALTGSDELINQIKRAIFYSKGVLGALTSARTDKVGLMNAWGGINAQLNRVAQEANNRALPTFKFDWEPLVTIDGPIADVMIEDVNLLITKLEYFEHLLKLNRGLLLNEQPKVYAVKNRNNYLALTRFVNNIPLEIKDELTDLSYDVLKSTIEDKDVFKLSTSEDDFGKVSRSDMEQLISEDVVMGEAFKTFVSLNEHIFHNSDKLAKLLNPEVLGEELIHLNKQTLNRNTKNINASAFAWLLFSWSSVSTKSFHWAISEHVPSGIAPVPSQLPGIHLTLGYVLNKSLYNVWTKALNKGVLNWFEGLTLDKRKETLQQFFRNKLDMIDYFADNGKLFIRNLIATPIFNPLIEGIPGSGKTKAVLAVIKSILFAIDPNLKNKVGFINISERSALELRSSLNETDGATLSHTNLLKEILVDYKEVSAEAYKEENDKDLNTDRSHKLEDDLLTTTLLVKEVTDTPYSILFIDEIGRLGTHELLAIANYAKKYGTLVISAGDYHQSHKVIEYDTKLFNGKPIPYTAIPVRELYPNVLKIGFSMRSDNDQISWNITLFLDYLENGIDKISLQVAKVNVPEGKNNGIFGTLIYTGTPKPDGTGLSYAPSLSAILSDIDLMISSLKTRKVIKNGVESEELETIGYIFNDKNSELYLALFSKSNPNYKASREQHIIKFRDDLVKSENSEEGALGYESQYYIIEPAVSEKNGTGFKAVDTDSYMSNLYTGISRSKQGNILIIPNNDKLTSYLNLPPTFIHLATKGTPTITTYTPEAIVSFTNDYKNAVKAIATNVEALSKVLAFEDLAQSDQPKPASLYKVGDYFLLKGGAGDGNDLTLLITEITDDTVKYEIIEPDGTKRKDTEQSIEDFNKGIDIGLIVEKLPDMPNTENASVVDGEKANDSQAIETLNAGDSKNPNSLVPVPNVEKAPRSKEQVKQPPTEEPDGIQSKLLSWNGESTVRPGVIDLNLYSFLSIYPGVRVNDDGTVTLFAQGDRRRDMINGILYAALMVSLGKLEPQVSLELYNKVFAGTNYNLAMQLLYTILGCIKSFKDNAELTQAISRTLGLSNEGAYIRYAFVSNDNFTSSSGEYNIAPDKASLDTIRRHSRHESEAPIDTEGNSLRGEIDGVSANGRIPIKYFALIYGNESLQTEVIKDGKKIINGGDILEIPLGGFSNPISIAETLLTKAIKDPNQDDPLLKALKSVKGNSEFEIISKLLELVKADPTKFYDPTKNNIVNSLHDDLIELLDLWIKTGNFTYYMPNDFVFAKSITNNGPEHSNVKGAHSIDPKFDLNNVSKNIDALYNSGLFQVLLVDREGNKTLPLYTFKSDQKLGNLEPGRAFALFTTLDNNQLAHLIDSDTAVSYTQYFTNQFGNGNVPRVIDYVLLYAPAALYTDWIANIHTIMRGEKILGDNIGNNVTSYRIFEALFKNNLWNTFWNNEVSKIYASEKSNRFLKFVEEINALNLLSLSLEELLKALQKPTPLKSIPINQSLERLFTRFFHLLTYEVKWLSEEERTKWANKVGNLINSILGTEFDALRYQLRTEVNGDLGFYLVNEGKGYVTDRNGNMLPILTRAKVDPEVFSSVQFTDILKHVNGILNEKAASNAPYRYNVGYINYNSLGKALVGSSNSLVELGLLFLLNHGFVNSASAWTVADHPNLNESTYFSELYDVILMNEDAVRPVVINDGTKTTIELMDKTTLLNNIKGTILPSLGLASNLIYTLEENGLKHKYSITKDVTGFKIMEDTLYLLDNLIQAPKEDTLQAYINIPVKLVNVNSESLYVPDFTELTNLRNILDQIKPKNKRLFKDVVLDIDTLIDSINTGLFRFYDKESVNNHINSEMLGIYLKLLPKLGLIDLSILKLSDKLPNKDLVLNILKDIQLKNDQPVQLCNIKFIE